MIWREMSGNGAGIGMGMILLRYSRILVVQLRVRGGCSEVVLAWNYYAFYCRTAVARSNGPANANCRIGFRLARSAPL